MSLSLNIAATLKAASACGALLMLALSPAMGKTHVLAQAGETPCVIAVDAGAPEVERTAADALKRYLEQATGATFPLVAAAGAESRGPVILVGSSARARELAPELVGDSLGTEGIVIRTVGDDWVLAGGEPRGTLNAVFTFLQEQVGCRWYAPEQEWVPQHETLALESMDQVYVPPFQLRWLYTVVQRQGEAADPLFAAKFRQNGGERATRYGGGLGFGGAHTMDKWVLPPDLFFEEHPDWYAMNAEGERIPRVACYSSEGGLAMATERVLERIREEYPTWTYDAEKIISVSHPDVGAHCRCPQCRALFLQYNTHAASLLNYVNAIAEAVAEEYPDVTISTLAYWGTASPPVGMKARDNVLVHFGIANEQHHWNKGRRSLVVRDFSKSFQDNTVLAGYLEGWTQIAGRLYVWDYYTNFENMIQPYPSWKAFPESLPYYRDLGVSGVFAQGGWSPAGEFPQMKYWVASQMMWNPDEDPQALTLEFLDAYYGNAGPILMDYLELMASAPGVLRSYEVCTRGWLTLELLNEATLLFDEAEAVVAHDPELLHRVKRERLGLDLVWIQRYRELQETARREGQPFLGPEDPVAELERLARNEYGAGAYREWGGFSEYIAMLRQLYPARSGHGPSVGRALLPHEWLEFQEDVLAGGSDGREIVSDRAASNGKAFKLVADGEGLSWQLPSAVPGPRGGIRADFGGEWQVWLDLKNDNYKGDIIIYFSTAKALLHETRVQAREAYQLVDLGVHPLAEEENYIIRVRPSEPGSSGSACLIDRLVLVSPKEGATL